MNESPDTKPTRYDVFCTLVKAKKPMSLSQIARKMKIPRQNVAYHMPFLEDAGLVIRDGSEYFCQPVFVNDKIRCQHREDDRHLRSCSTPDLTDAETDEDRERIAKNCLQVMIFIRRTN